MIEDLVASLDRRGVNVEITARYNKRDCRIRWRGDVKPDGYGVHGSWPSFEFFVIGHTLEEVEGDIRQRLHLVEPIIAAREKHREHRAALRNAEQLGEELAGLCQG
uniref:Uncharacterized protein n=1 Tax=Rhizobium leguminosarum TaxID=384 RepID=A0A179BTQ4_RHILE|nr:hypothetical protein [Rhizobium leguminosarum]OAP95062.1 hypothetical protein A4U53_17710 [Rhizobium leguminosarum]